MHLFDRIFNQWPLDLRKHMQMLANMKIKGVERRNSRNLKVPGGSCQVSDFVECVAQWSVLPFQSGLNPERRQKKVLQDQELPVLSSTRQTKTPTKTGMSPTVKLRQ